MENGEGTYMQNDRFFSLEKNLMGRELFNENNYRAETFFSNITLRCFFRHERPTGISLTYVPEGKNLIFFCFDFHVRNSNTFNISGICRGFVQECVVCLDVDQLTTT